MKKTTKNKTTTTKPISCAVVLAWMIKIKMRSDDDEIAS
jgi:hypothetical protein